MWHLFSLFPFFFFHRVVGFCTGSTAHIYNLIELLGSHMCLYLILDLSDLCQIAHFVLSVGYYCEMWVSETQEIFWNVIALQGKSQLGVENSLNHKHQWWLLFCCMPTCSDLFFDIMTHYSTFNRQS